MKKTISVNLFGMLYPIDEDAYNLLSNYLESLRKYFASRSGGEEIVTDIEARVAELMNELMVAGANAITIDDIERIISRIGSPEELDSDDTHESDTCSPASGHAPAAKKLFRDTDYGIVGGVFAGLGEYLGIKPLWLRVIAVILAFISFGWCILLYLIAWICIPAAITPVDRLEMKGEPVNMETIRKMILDNVNKMRENTHAPGLATRLGHIVGAILRGVFYILCGGFVLAALCCMVFVIFLYIQASLAISGSEIVMDWVFAQSVLECSPTLINVSFVTALICLALVATLGCYAIVVASGRNARLRLWAVVGGIILFIVSAGVFFSSYIPLYKTFERSENRHYEIREAERRKAEKSRAGKILEADGWTVVRDSNVGEALIDNGGHYSGYYDKYYLHAREAGGPMSVEIVRKEKVAPGTYTLQAMGRTNGDGAEIFAVTSGGRYASEIVPFGNEGGEVWAKAVEALSDATLTDRDRVLMERYADVNCHSGYGWSKITVDGIVVGSDSLVTYGVTNVGPNSIWNGSWFSATEFILRKN